MHTIVDTLCDVVLSRMPKRARLTKVLQRIKTNNVMGDRGENLITFSEGLMRDLHQSGWESMTMAEAGVLMWLTDLTLTNPHHVKLSEKVHTAWDLAETRDKQFTIMNCITVASDHWSKVREVELTIGQKQGGGGGTKNTNKNTNDYSKPPKKRCRRNKKGQGHHI